MHHHCPAILFIVHVFGYTCDTACVWYDREDNLWALVHSLPCGSQVSDSGQTLGSKCLYLLRHLVNLGFDYYRGFIVEIQPPPLSPPCGRKELNIIIAVYYSEIIGDLFFFLVRCHWSVMPAPGGKGGRRIAVRLRTSCLHDPKPGRES